MEKTSRNMMMIMTMYHKMKSKARTIGLIILMMAQTEIMGMMTQVMMMVLTHTFKPHPMIMIDTKDPMTQQKRNN